MSMSGSKDRNTTTTMDREPLTTASRERKAINQKRREKYKENASIWEKEKKTIDKLTEAELDDFLKKYEFRINEKRDGSFLMKANAYEFALIRKMRLIKGRNFSRFIYGCFTKEIEAHEKMLQSLEK